MRIVPGYLLYITHQTHRSEYSRAYCKKNKIVYGSVDVARGVSWPFSVQYFREVDGPKARGGKKAIGRIGVI